MQLPYGYSLTTFEQDANYPPDTTIFMTNPYPTVADNLASMPGYQLRSQPTIISLPTPLNFSSLPIIPKVSPTPPTSSMVYYQATTSPGQQITQMPVSQTFSIGADSPADYVSANPILSQLLIFGVVAFLFWRGFMQNA